MEIAMAMTKCKECGNDVSDKAESCPNCGVKVPKKAGLLIKLGGGFVAFVFLIAIFSPSKQGGTSAQQEVAATSAMIPEFKTTAKEIAAAYDENTVAADAKFKGKVFEVSGVISAINTDMMENAVLLLQGGVNEFMEPQFKLSNTDKPKAATLKKGAKVTLVCEGNGDIVKTPMMSDCSII